MSVTTFSGPRERLRGPRVVPFLGSLADGSLQRLADAGIGLLFRIDLQKLTRD